MARIITFGQQPTDAPAGTFREIEFPLLAPLDEGTKEGMVSRKLSSEGGRARDGMPLTISMQYIDDFGHSRSVPVGALHEITFDGETKKVSGKGWVADSDDGRLAELMVVSDSLAHNSVDLGEIARDGVKITEHGDWWDDDFWVEIEFVDYAVAKTTLVATPAFAKARADMDEIMASYEPDGPLVVEAPGVFTGYQPVEIAAGALTLPSWDHFHRPESDIPHKIIVGTKDENGWIPVYGHLAEWNKPHRGYDGKTVYPPRPRHNYREWNQAGPLTDRGQVETGPIVLYGGHVSLKEAADDPRNAWADVRTTAGRHGPWVCGVVRPHVSEDDAETYVARASRLSGHWKGDDLAMIISCNAEGFNIHGVGSEPGQPDELVAALHPSEPDEIVAGFETPAERLAIPTELFSFTELSAGAQTRVLAWAQGETATGSDDDSVTDATAEPKFDAEAQAERDRIVAEFLAEHADA